MTTATAPYKAKSAPPSKTSAGSGISLAVMLVVAALIVAGAIYLLKTNPATGVWAQAYDPTGHWLVSTLFAALPVVVLLGAMAIFHLKAHVASVLGLGTALTVAIALYHMPVRLALTTAVYGGGYGLFPICWIILPVIFLYQLTVKTGRFVMLQESLTNITDDGRLQLLLIAFALGAFFEGASGFGTPVAVCGAILISLGFKPIQAAGLSLIANTAPVAFGALGIPIITLQAVTGLDLMVLTKMTALILIPFCMLVPFWLIWAYAGFKKMIEVWPPILVAATTFSAAQYLMAANFGPWLVAIVASTSTIVVLIIFLQFWKPKRELAEADGAADRCVAFPDGFGQFGGRRDGQDDRCTEHRSGQHGNAELRARGNDPAVRLLAQPCTGLHGRLCGLPARIRLPIHQAGRPLNGELA